MCRLRRFADILQDEKMLSRCSDMEKQLMLRVERVTIHQSVVENNASV